MLAKRSLASIITRSATSSSLVNRPVIEFDANSWVTSSGDFPLASPSTLATPSRPAQKSVATGPGSTVLTRMFCAPNSFDSALEDC